jgi:hypothetical protein
MLQFSSTLPHPVPAQLSQSALDGSALRTKLPNCYKLSLQIWELSALERVMFAFLFSLQVIAPQPCPFNHQQCFPFILLQKIMLMLISPTRPPSSLQSSSSPVFRSHFPYRDCDEDYLVLITACAPIDIGAFVDDDRTAVKDGQLLVDESAETIRRFR